MSESQDNTAEIISNLLSAYMKGYNVIKDNQSASLDTSKSNATENTNTITSTTPSVLDWVKVFADSNVLSHVTDDIFKTFNKNTKNGTTV